jgi:LysM repeat protein
MVVTGGVGTSTNTLNGGDVSAADQNTTGSANAQEFENAVATFADERQGFQEAAENLQEAEQQAQEEAKETDFVDNVDAIADHAEIGNALPFSNRDRPASDRTFGKSEHIATAADTLESIASQYGQSVDDLLLANPNLSRDTPLQRGQRIAVYDETRLDFANEITATTDPEKLEEFIGAELIYAAHESSTPDDLLGAIKADILARRNSNDSQFISIVEDAGSWASDLWARQGRTHEVMDKLQSLVDQGNGDALNQEIYGLLRDTAERSPTTKAVDEQVETLLRFGPAGSFFANVVKWAADFFNFGQVEEAAANIDYTYKTEGAEAGASLLASYTNPSNFDALTSSRLLYAAQDTTSQIVTHLGAGEYHQWSRGLINSTASYQSDLDTEEKILGSLSEAVENASLSIESAGAIERIAHNVSHTTGYYYSDLVTKEAIFGDLSEAVENASLSPESADAIERMATEINNQMFTYVATSIMKERGTTLPIEMALLLQTVELDVAVLLGLNVLGAKNSNIAVLVASTSTHTKNADEEIRKGREIETLDDRLDDFIEELIYSRKN